MIPRIRPTIKHLLTYFIITVFSLPFILYSQTVPTRKLIEGFKAKDKNQTIINAKLYGDLTMNFNEQKFMAQASEIKKYLSKNDDKRVKIRMFMYERFAFQKMKKPDNLNTKNEYLKIIKLANSLDDEQLLSELYSKYSALCEPTLKLYYLLKCIEIREHIGINYFTDLSENYYRASEMLYEISDYKSSAIYASKSTTLYTKEERKDYLHYFILTADLAGASYLKINEPDSAIYYYKTIDNLVNNFKALPNKYKLKIEPEIIEIWRGLVKGGIAKAYILQGKEDIAYGLLLQNLKSSTQFKQWDDVAGVQNSLAKIDVSQGNISKALTRYLKAYQLASKSEKLAILVTASEGASSSYALMHQYDSAYVYHKLYLQWKEIVDKNINQSRLDIVKAQIDFEQMQKVLLQSQNNLINQKHIRNSILIAIVFLATIALLLYNRKRLQMSLQNEKLEKAKQKSETEKKYAQQQINSILQKMAEKNSLIKKLQIQIRTEKIVEVNNTLNDFTILTEEDWQQFKINFETVNPNFLHRLKQKMPQTTQGEQRIILLAKLGLNTKEMANATGVSAETIRSVSSRLRKKFNLEKDLYTLANEI